MPLSTEEKAEWTRFFQTENLVEIKARIGEIKDAFADVDRARDLRMVITNSENVCFDFKNNVVTDFDRLEALEEVDEALEAIVEKSRSALRR